MEDADLRELTLLLQRPGAVAPADGLPVAVRSLHISHGHGQDELVIDYSVPPLPDGTARQPLPQDDDLAAYADAVAEELQAWATGHVRRHRPLPPPDRDRVRRELPSREELWHMLRSDFRAVRDVPGGFAGTNRFNVELRVMLTAEQWQDYVIGCEIGCRNDYGVDADSAGDGPMVAMSELDEAMATMDPDEIFLVLDGHELTGSVRAGLPAVPGMASKREMEAFLRRGRGRWYPADDENSSDE